MTAKANLVDGGGRFGLVADYGGDELKQKKGNQ
jgi:hypothetical protein